MGPDARRRLGGHRADGCRVASCGTSPGAVTSSWPPGRVIGGTDTRARRCPHRRSRSSNGRTRPADHPAAGRGHPAADRLLRRVAQRRRPPVARRGSARREVEQPSELVAWDVPSGRRLGVPMAAPGPVAFVVLAPDGRRAAVLLRAEPGATPAMAMRGRIPTRSGSGTSNGGGACPCRSATAGMLLLAAFSPDGRRLVTVQPGRAQVWDAVTGQARRLEGRGAGLEGGGEAAGGGRPVAEGPLALRLFRPGRPVAGRERGGLAGPSDRSGDRRGLGAAACSSEAETSLVRFSGDGRRLIVGRDRWEPGEGLGRRRCDLDRPALVGVIPHGGSALAYRPTPGPGGDRPRSAMAGSP